MRRKKYRQNSYDDHAAVLVAMNRAQLQHALSLATPTELVRDTGMVLPFARPQQGKKL